MNHSVIILTLCTMLFWTPAILLRFTESTRILPAPSDVLLVFPFSGMALLLAARWQKQSRLMRWALGFHLLSCLAATSIFFLT